MAPPQAQRTRFGLLLIAGLLFFVFPSLLSFAADWLWFGEVGYRPVLTRSISAQVLVGRVVFAVVAGWLLLNLRTGLQALAEDPVSFTTREGFTVALSSRAQLRPVAMLGAVAGAILVSLWLSFSPLLF